MLGGVARVCPPVGVEPLREPLPAATEAIPVGDPAEFSTFMGAVIDETSYRKHEAVLEAARSDPDLTIVAGGECDSEVGWFVHPTIIATSNPHHDLLQARVVRTHPHRVSVRRFRLEIRPRPGGSPPRRTR